MFIDKGIFCHQCSNDNNGKQNVTWAGSYVEMILVYKICSSGKENLIISADLVCVPELDLFLSDFSLHEEIETRKASEFSLFGFPFLDM